MAGVNLEVDQLRINAFVKIASTWLEIASA